MKKFSEAEAQLLIAVGWLKSRYGLMARYNNWDVEKRSRHLYHISLS
jgi:hypothetical protein